MFADKPGYLPCRSNHIIFVVERVIEVEKTSITLFCFTNILNPIQSDRKVQNMKEKLVTAIVDMQEEEALQLTQELLDAGEDPMVAPELVAKPLLPASRQ